MAHAEQVDATIGIDRAIGIGAERAVRRVVAAHERPGLGVDPVHAQLAGVVGLAVVAQIDVHRPTAAHLVVERELAEMALAVHVVERLVQPFGARDGERLERRRIERRAAIERRQIFAIFVPDDRLRGRPVIGDRRGDEGLAVGAEIAPIVLIDMIDDQPIGEGAMADRPGRIEGHVIAVARIGIGRPQDAHHRVGCQLRLLADDVDHAAGIHDPIKERAGALQDFDALGSGVESAALHQRHAVVHDRPVTVAAEAALHDRVLGARERVLLGDAADIGERVVEIAGLLVADDLRRDDVHGGRGP